MCRLIFITPVLLVLFLLVMTYASYTKADCKVSVKDELNNLPKFVRVVIKDDQGRFLLMKTKYNDKSYWNFVGGKVEKNETTREAAKRETFEEIGILLNDYKNLGEFTTDVEGVKWSGSVYLENDNHNKNEIINKEPEKCLELSFKTYDEILSLKDVSSVTKDIFSKFNKHIFTDARSQEGHNNSKTLGIQSIYSLLRSNKSLTKQHFLELKESTAEYTKAQLGSLAAQLTLRKKKTKIENECISYLKTQDAEIEEYINVLEKSIGIKNINNKLVNILWKVNSQLELAPEEIDFVFNEYDANKISDTYMAVLLMTISYKGLSDKNISKMTQVMSDSGHVYDYRNNPALKNRKIIRRYPTGGLSEKIALIMPSVIIALSEKYPIASNFLVAKTLSYTGGTWDKLNSIPGFTFPTQGEETILTLNQCSVAMSVTNDGFNSLDRKLYQLRGVTGTVESVPLIIASIASKQLAIPADFLLMDVRYGSGAFVGTYTEGKKLAIGLMQALRHKMNVDYFLTKMEQPNGMSIGNELEIIEAIAIMKNDIDNTMFDTRGLKEQKELVIIMLSKMLHEIFPKVEKGLFTQEINKAFENKVVIESFKKLLICHKVPHDVVEKLISNPLSLIQNYDSFVVVAESNGLLSHIDQRALGRLVNFELKTGLNEYVKKKNNGAGIVLKVRLGDEIKKGQPICVVFANKEYLRKNQKFIQDYIHKSFIFLDKRKSYVGSSMDKKN